MSVYQPGRRRRSTGGEVDRNSAVMQDVQHPVQPVELEAPVGLFEQRPGEDPDADQVDPGLLHQGNVLVPNILGPLLRVVVTAERDPPHRPARSRCRAIESIESAGPDVIGASGRSSSDRSGAS